MNARFPYVADLAEFMDARYGAGNWTQRCGIGQGTDIGPALVDACAFLRTTYGRGTIAIPPGGWLMNTSPTPAQLSGHRVIGQGSQASLLFWNANAGACLGWSGAGGYTGGGASGLGIMLESGYAQSQASAITLQGDATYQPDQTMWDDIYISAMGTSNWKNGFFTYGNARTSPQGIRVGDIRNLQIFRCWDTGFYGSNLVQWSGTNIGVYAGTGGGSQFWMTGGGTHLDFRLVNAPLFPSAYFSDAWINGKYYP